MLRQIHGDILKINSGTLIHQVNTLGITGGLAGALRRKYPDHFKEYIGMCQMNKPHALLGDFEVECAGDQRIAIVHLFGQLYPGPNTDLIAVRSALEKFSKWRAQGKDNGPIYAPFRMGCGLGGGDWSQYEPLLEQFIPSLIVVNNQTNQTT